MRRYVEDCLSTPDSCPLSGDVDDAMGEIADLLESLTANPMQTDDPEGRVLTRSLAFYGLAYPMYAPIIWPDLSSALNLALHSRDGSELLDLSDAYFGREGGQYTDNQTEAFTAINCLTHEAPQTLPPWRKKRNRSSQQHL